METPKPHARWIRNFYFWTGIIATIAYRIIVVLNNYSSTLVLIAWYIGTVGFVLYFIHRYQISETRSQLIQENDLVNKVAKTENISEKDKQVLHYILSTLSSSREKINYIFIFVASAVALIWGIYLDFIA